MNKCILMHKCYLTDLFQTNNSIHQYKSCQSNNLHVAMEQFTTHAKHTFLVYNSVSVIFYMFLCFNMHFMILAF